MTLSNPAQYISGRTVQEQMNSLIDYVDQRAADVALDAIASDVAQVHQDMLDADADATAAAASAAAAAGTLANAVKKTGEASQSIAGNIAVTGTLSGGVVTGTQVTVPMPTNNTDAATKKYVDDADALKADKTYVDAQDALKINITDVNNYAVGLTGNQNVSGDKLILGRILERCAYMKNTTGANASIPLFKMSPATKNDGYMNCVMLISGRTVPTTLTQLIWNNGTLTKTDIVGSQSNAFSIMSDASGNYWVCSTIAANNTLSAFVFQCMRNAGFIDGIQPLMQGETPDMTGWTTVVSQS